MKMEQGEGTREMMRVMGESGRDVEVSGKIETWRRIYKKEKEERKEGGRVQRMVT